jgi:hypothetical protein
VILPGLTQTKIPFLGARMPGIDPFSTAPLHA